jgi:outer membrane protein with beta-barrel domain
VVHKFVSAKRSRYADCVRALPRGHDVLAGRHRHRVGAGAVLSSLPHAGEVIDQISKFKSVDVAAKVGLTGGGFVQFSFGRVSLQPELLFAMKGVTLDLDSNAGTVTAGINYLEFPILLRYTMPLSGDLRGFIFGGPAFDVKFGTKATMALEGRNVELNIDPAFGSRDFGLALGGGIERDRYLIEARYTLGLIDIPTGIYSHNDALRNRAFSVMVGMRIP